MLQHLIVLGFEISKIIPYFLVGLIGLFVGFLYILRSITMKEFKNKTDRLYYVIQGIGSSMLITWISYEITNYFFNLPTSLCIAISGDVGYLGADRVSDLALDSLKKRI
ncbi:holin [Helicobacter pylori]|nr:holin [Helicobacter pylori]